VTVVGSVVSTDGTRLHVTTRGDGPPIVLVHGWKGSSRVWDRTVAALEDRFRVVAYDLRGMGHSEKPDCRYDFDEHAADLACVLELLGLEDATLVGWSMGCSVSLQHMARGGSRVGRLVLVNGPVRLTRTADFPWSMTQAELDGYVEAVEQSWPEHELAFQREGFLRPLDHVVGWMLAIALQTPLDVVLKTVRAQARLDHRDVVRSLAVPVLAIYGRHDPYYPPELADWIATTAPRGEALIMEESAHVPFLETDAVTFNDALARFASGEAVGRLRAAGVR
jgi:non-heme chloroperoxidase